MTEVTRRLLVMTALIGASLAIPAGDVRAQQDDTSLCDPSGTTVCRSVLVVNNCTQSLSIATLGNTLPCSTSAQCPTTNSTCSAGSCTCSGDADCATDQACGSDGYCHFGAPFGGGVQLVSGASRTTYLPNETSPGQSASWEGRFWARTSCPDFTTCTQPGGLCTSDAECCTNAGCAGLFTCQSSSDCSGTNTCIGGTCTCALDTDCRDGGKCNNGLCTGACENGGVSCQSGDCGSALACPVGSSGQSPTTLAEFALLPGDSTYDTYDVSQVNGFNVPVSIAPSQDVDPTPPAGFADAQPWCGSPGCASATDCPGQAGPCGFTSDFTSCLCGWGLNEDTCPDPLQAVWPMTCTSDADCGDSSKCDLSTVPATCTCRRDAQCPGDSTCGINTNIDGKKRVCGTYVGCVSSSDSCTADKRLKQNLPDGTPFSCKRFKDAYDCTGNLAGSCYTSGASSDCCGCPSWSVGGNAGPFPVTNGCQASSPRWTRVVEPLVEPYKNACPTAYSFQYDDPTSTFNCAGTGPTTPVQYKVTFCPTGSPGAAS